MTVIATASNPRFFVSRVDIDRAGPTYTIDTLRELRRRCQTPSCSSSPAPTRSAEILTWHDADKLFELAHFVGCTRPGHTIDAATLSGVPADRVTMIEIPALAISSTECRRGARAGEPVWYLVPDGVVQYITKHAPLPARPTWSQERPVTATERAVELVETAAQAASDKLAETSSPSTCPSSSYHRRLRDLLGVQRPAGPRDRRRDRGQAARDRRQADPPRRRA